MGGHPPSVAFPPGKAVQPDPKAVAAYRDKGGYLDRLEKEFSRLQL